MNILLLNPVAFSIGSLDVHWYGIILGAAALAGLLIAIQEGKRFGLNADFFLDLMLFGVPSAIIAARLYYVAFKWDYYKSHPAEIIQIWNGGIAIYGALIGALICGFFYIRAKGYSFWRVVDICAPSLLIGQMIGRWGNFVNQEAYGGPVEESFLRDTLNLPGFIVNQMNVEGTFHHPTFLYESLWSLVGLAVLFIIRRRNFLRAGELFFIYFIWYSIGRFFIEALRTDSLAFRGPEWLRSLLDALWSPMTVVFEQGYLNPAEGNIRISQLLALLIVVAGIALIVLRRQLGWAKEKYNDPLINVKTGKPAGESKTETESTQNDATEENHDRPV
ncbi:prolipoprotein diacylglyceryl transferase [Paenibacillaceae bacterium WGS1546]|uniref:prolipoprotein diacylglyceryl transferase n=1 Tax=Cohnella sp. WGS1546 TaxID=3366810 RepID=UPI00372D13BE